ncbi:MAG: hypothetical protein HY644_13770 [Acidobacteria bacterium]|nr:hypothetical protein [Acidobacteriota bacterium]
MKNRVFFSSLVRRNSPQFKVGDWVQLKTTGRKSHIIEISLADRPWPPLLGPRLKYVVKTQDGSITEVFQHKLEFANPSLDPARLDRPNNRCFDDPLTPNSSNRI